MIYPIVSYGNKILREIAKPITQDYPNLHNIILNMWETLYITHGVGIAAPQVKLPIRLFLIDSKQIFDENKESEYLDNPGFKGVFINPNIIEESGENWLYEEGCLSIPYIKANIERKQNLKIEYFDENFIKHTTSFNGISARIIFHEYDHLNGKLFIDKMSSLKRKIFASKLNDISKGKIKAHYKMI